MIKLVLTFLLLWVMPANAQFCGKPGFCGVKAGAAPPSTISLDANQGFVSAPGATSGTVTISTTTTNQVIVVLLTIDSTTVTSVSGSTLGAFTQRAVGNRFGGQFVYSYTKVAASILTSEVITVTTAGSGGTLVINGFSVKGINTAAPFDTNGSLPSIVGTGGAGGAFPVVSTTAANTFIYGVIRYDVTDPANPGSGWSLLYQGDVSLMEYKIVTSAQTSLTVDGSGPVGDVDAAIGDALKQ